MAENDEYYKEIVEKQRELLITLISTKKKHDYSSEIANLQKRFASFSHAVASIRLELGSIKRQLSKIETELSNIKNEITLNKLITNEDFSNLERHLEENNQSTWIDEIAEPLSQQIEEAADTLQ